jgi:hypothetical protein
MYNRVFSKQIKNRHINLLRFMIGSLGEEIDIFDFDLYISSIWHGSIDGKIVIHRKIKEFFMSEGFTDTSRIFLYLIIILVLIRLVYKYALYDSIRPLRLKKDELLKKMSHHEMYYFFISDLGYKYSMYYEQIKYKR